jgi:hypothetical protein
MNALAVFFTDVLIFVLAFRSLSAPGAAFPGAFRMALGVLTVFVATVITLWVAPSAWALLIVAVAGAIGSIAIQGDGLERLSDALGKYRFAVYVLSVAGLAALVLLVVPITTFLTSPGEVSIHLDYLLTVNARDAMVVVYIAAVLYAMAITSRMKTAITILALGALALALIYAFAMPFGYPMMTGLTFELLPVSLSGRMLRLFVDIAVVIAVGLGLRQALIRFGARPIFVALVMINVSLGIAATLEVHRDEIGASGGPGTEVQTPVQPLHFSPTHPNVLVVFLDRFMGSYIESILQTDPELAQRLSGFTWYPRTVSAGENSIAGVHPMLGGYDYTPVEMNARGKPLLDLSVEAFSILPYNFSKKGYRVNVVSPRGLGFTMAGDCKYLEMDGVSCTHISPTVASNKARQVGFPLNDLAKSDYADLLVLLGSMRGAPYVLKEALRVNGPWRPFMDHSAGTTFRQWAELQAFGTMSETRAEQSNFNFISSILPHEPYFIGEDCRPQQEQFVVPLDEVHRRGHTSLFSLQHSIAARCTLLGVADYLDFLKSAGVYDNTRIVIVSDHGIVGDVEDTSARAVAGGTQQNLFVRTRSLLLVKDAGAVGALRISDQFMPNAEVPRIVCEQIGGCVNPYLNDRPIEARGRDDPFYVSLVPWQFSLQNHTSFVINEQYVLKGKDPFDAKGWVVLKSSAIP